MKISKRAQNITPSATMKVSARAKEMKRNGIDVINLSVGEPDFATPDKIKEAGHKAIDENRTKYTVNPGIPELREAISAKFKRDNNLEYSPDEIIVSCGAKHSIFNTLLAIVDEGDEVIVPAPYWVSYPHMVRMAGGDPIVIETTQQNGFKLNPEELDNHITSKTNCIILCNPSNPTGAAYTEKELEGIAEVVLDRKINVISDEIYEKLIYGSYKFKSFPEVKPGLKDYTIVVNGVSKAYAMTGWRIGYAAGPIDVIKAINKIQSHSTSHACSISQYASLEAMLSDDTEINKMKSAFEERRKYLHTEINRIEGVTCNLPEGAFYLFVNINKLLNLKPDIKNSADLSMYLLEEGHVATVPGSAFGAEGFIRFSYAASMEELQEAVKRINTAVENLRN